MNCESKKIIVFQQEQFFHLFENAVSICIQSSVRQFQFFKLFQLFKSKTEIHSFSMNQSRAENFFAGVMQWDGLKFFYLVFQIIISVVGPSLLYSIYWYERFSADLRFRTLLNQLISHFCLLNIAGCIFARCPYVLILFFGPFSVPICDFTILTGRFLFLCVLTEITIRQTIKFSYIFQQKLVAMNADFAAVFITLCNLTLSGCLCLVTFMIGFHTSEVDYHICTGRSPDENIKESFKYLDFNSNNKTDNNYSFGDLVLKDPLGVTSKILLLINIILTLCAWIHSYYIIIPSSSNNITINNINGPLSHVPLTTNSRFEESRNFIVGAGGNLILIVLAIVLLFPSHKSKMIASYSMEAINFGNGRLWIYISRISVPLLAYCLFPMIIIANNSKMRASLKREVMEILQQLS